MKFNFKDYSKLFYARLQAVVAPGAIAPRRSMLAPRHKVKSDFFRRFLAFIVP